MNTSIEHYRNKLAFETDAWDLQRIVARWCKYCGGRRTFRSGHLNRNIFRIPSICHIER